MKKSMKAALLSGLVFPGLGHLFLKRYLPGTILASVSVVAIYFLITRMLETAFQIAEQIQRDAISLDIAAITELVASESTGDDLQQLNVAMTVLVICWIIGIVDSYRAGSAQDKHEDALAAK